MVVIIKNLKFCMFVLLATSILVITWACNSIVVKPAATPTTIPTVGIQPAASELTLTVQGMERTYFLCILSGLSNQKSVAMVFLLHGYRESDKVRLSTSPL